MKAATIPAVALVLTLLAAPGLRSLGQEPMIERPPPPAVDDFETDANKDGVPDGWYNARDVKLVSEGGPVGPHCLRFEVRKPGRPARLSRAFGVDGSKTEALVLGLWVRLDQVFLGERLGEEPGLLIDFLGDELRAPPGAARPLEQVGRHELDAGRQAGPGPARHPRRHHVDRPARRHRGPRGRRPDDRPHPPRRLRDDEPGRQRRLRAGRSRPCLLESRWRRASLVAGSEIGLGAGAGPTGTRAMTGLAIPVEPFHALDVRIYAKGQGLRGAGGASARLFLLDDLGAIVPDPFSGQDGSPVVIWSGTFDWRPDHAVIAVPPKAVRAVLQVEKLDANGSVRIDRVAATAAPDPAAGAWVPYHVEDDTSGWDPVRPSATIEEKSALDASYLLDAPAGKRGFVTVRDGRLGFTKGGRARFFGAYLLPPTPFLEPKEADALADRLARSGINLVRLGDLDTSLGPDRSLYDDSRDDTKAFDPIALTKLDHLIAALKARGIHIALELQSVRRYRSEDGVADVEQLPLGGGPAAAFDSTLGQLALGSARALLEHVNPETGLALRDDPVLAWVTLAGELSLFNQIEDPHGLTPHYAESLRKLAAQSPSGAGRRSWQAVESEHWKEMAEALRRDMVRVPIAGVSHWRREPEFSAAQAAAGLDMIDDRLYWDPPSWISPERRSLLWSLDGGLAAGAVPQAQARPSLRGRSVVRPVAGGLGMPVRGGRPAARVADRAGRGLGRTGPPRRVPSAPGLGIERDRDGGSRGHLPDPRGRQRLPPDLRALAARRVDPAPGPPGAGEQRAPPRASPRDPAPVRAHPRLGPDARAARHRHALHARDRGLAGRRAGELHPAQDHDRRALRGRRRLVGGPRADRNQQAVARLGAGAGRADRLSLG